MKNYETEKKLREDERYYVSGRNWFFVVFLTYLTVYFEYMYIIMNAVIGDYCSHSPLLIGVMMVTLIVFGVLTMAVYNTFDTYRYFRDAVRDIRYRLEEED